MTPTYKGPERREFIRLDYTAPLDYKVCKKVTISKLLQGYTADVSSAGLRCNIKIPVKKGDIIWLSFDRATLGICADLEKRSLIYQNGVIGKVIRAERKEGGNYSIGVQFLTREEKHMTGIFPKSFTLKSRQKSHV